VNAPVGTAGPLPREVSSAGQIGGATHPRVFSALKWTSFTHSCIYTALLVCAFALGGPQPETFVLGLSHGLLWIFMSLACLACVRLRIVPLRLAVAVAVLGGIGPFFGSYEFVREQRRRRLLGDDDGARAHEAAAQARARVQG
jgi:hypothetical protein